MVTYRLTIVIIRHPFTLPFVHSQRPEFRDLDEEYPYLQEIINLLCDELEQSKPGFNRRDFVFQGETNDMDFVVNAQTLINISRKRLCRCASKETREAWELVRQEISKIDPIMAAAMVPNCVYRGFCPEMRCCGFSGTKKHNEDIKNYRNLINRGNGNNED